MKDFKPFVIDDYFEDLGDGWRLNTITESVFFNNQEIVTNRKSARKVLAAFLRCKNGFKVWEYLKKNLIPIDCISKKNNHTSALAKLMFVMINRILNKHGFKIQLAGGMSSQNAKWSLVSC